MERLDRQRLNSGSCIDYYYEAAMISTLDRIIPPILYNDKNAIPTMLLDSF